MQNFDHPSNTFDINRSVDSSDDTLNLNLGEDPNGEEEIIDPAGALSDDLGQDDSADEEVFRMPVKGANGEEEEIEVKGAELPDLVGKGRLFEPLLRDYQALKQNLESNSYLQQSIVADPFLHDIVSARLNGHSPEAIFDALNKRFSEIRAQETMPEITDPDIKAAVEARFAAEAAERKRLEAQIQAGKANTDYTENKNHNNNLLVQALNHGGFEYKDTPEFAAKVAKAVQTLYPGQDLNRGRITQQQAEAIIRMSELPKRTGAQKVAVNAVRKASKVTRVLPGGQPQGARRTKPPVEKEMTAAQAREAYEKMGLPKTPKTGT